MKAKILGTRGKVPQSAPLHENHSGILIDNKILIDVGESSYMNTHPEAVVFTHFHPDHAYFMTGKELFAPDIPVFGPEAHDLVPGMKVISGTFRIGEYEFTPVPVIHSLRLRSLAYLVEKDTKKLFLTGDVAWIEKSELQDFPQVDLVITEATFIQKGGRIRRREDRIFGHTGIPDLVRILGSHTSRIAFVHFGSWFFKDVQRSKEEIRSFQTEGLELIPCHDGMELTI